MSEAIQLTKQKTEKVEKTSTEIPAIFTKLFGDLEFNRYGLIGAVLILVVCTASIAVGVGSMVNPVEIGFLIFPCVITISFVLAVAPMKTIMYSSIVSLLISTTLIIINLV